MAASQDFTGWRDGETQPNADWWLTAAAHFHRKGSLCMQEEAKTPVYTDTCLNRYLQVRAYEQCMTAELRNWLTQALYKLCREPEKQSQK